MRIHEIPVDDEPLTRRFWEIGRAADEQGRPWSGFWSWEAARASFHASLASDAPNTKVLLGAYDGETMVGAAEPQRWDEQRLREKEERFERAGHHETTTLAIAPDREIVGMTEAMVSDHAPDRAFQGSTIVEPESFPGCRTMLTGNADVNVAMNAVNERLGFRPVERVHEMQKRLGRP